MQGLGNFSIYSRKAQSALRHFSSNLPRGDGTPSPWFSPATGGPALKPFADETAGSHRCHLQAQQTAAAWIQ